MEIVSTSAQPLTASYQRKNRLVRVFALSMVGLTLIYLINNYLNVWHDWPGVAAYFFTSNTAENAPVTLAWLQLVSYLIIVPVVVLRVFKTDHRLIDDSDRISRWVEYIIRTGFWSVVLIGLLDGLISWMRVENLLQPVFGEALGTNLGKSDFRGTWVHYPLILISMVLAVRFKTVSVSWLALLVVFSEAWIVVARFIFSYEQTLMGDLVRFWYASLLLFSSAYTLTKEGHVRVDVLYAQASTRYKAWANTIGIFLLALPLCWVILLFGLWDKSSILNSPLVSFEISQSAYGLFVKYLMASFLIVFAVTMMLQFCSYLLRNVAILTGEVEVKDDHHDDVIA
ncbi:MAG: hypothetical protein CSA61_00190 [Neptuniibacter caesariensis]|uniref:TRAP transporter small permease protein n=1 Tax=Neptuniibacter caesariensis TaxID=207954 RepID=A0A2G6JBU5_NEPCE|nr:MAG: hypothetical protein CSA61_00190 [Neptuniibacter caesariensis]